MPQPSVTDDFAGRLHQVIQEFGSRSALAKVSGIPGSTLQDYEGGSKPGIDALLRLARIANLDLNWLIAGEGEKRPKGTLAGGLLADVLVVSQYQLGAALSMEQIIGYLPFSRFWLERELHLEEPTDDTLLAVAAEWNLHQVSTGDLVLVDRRQRNLDRDGIYLLDLPGMVLRSLIRGIGDKLIVVGPEAGQSAPSAHHPSRAHPTFAGRQEVRRRDLLGNGGSVVSKVVGRAVWIGHRL